MFNKIIRKTNRSAGLQITCLLSASAFLWPTLATAEPVADSSPWVVDANRITRFKNPDSIVAEGNVVMTRKGASLTGSEKVGGGSASSSASPLKPLVIKGDWVRLDTVENVVKVRGHAYLESDEEEINAEVAVLDLDDQTGTLTGARLYFPKRKLLLVGDKVQKSGELTYHLEDGWATKCEPRDKGVASPWSFGWQEANITAGGFVHLHHMTFRVKDVPVAYTPYFAFPTNQDRKTGLLLPEFSHSGRDGNGLVVPLFLNLSPSFDATLYGGHFTNRGNFAGGEFRYVYEEESQGVFALNYLRDRLDDFDDDFKEDGIFRTTKNRYWLRGKVDHDFGSDWTAKLDIDLISDRDYLQEFQDGRLGFEESEKRFKSTFMRGFDSETTFKRNNVAQLSKFWTDTALNAEIRTINDSTDTPSTSHLWSLPKVNFGGRLPMGGYLGAPESVGVLSNVDLAWDSEYVYYRREDGVGAQRLDLQPRLISPVNLSPYLETTVSAGLRETMYLVDDNSMVSQGYESDVMSRTLQDYNITTSTIFMRDFTVNTQGFSRLTHMIRPELSYDYIPTQPQGKYPKLDGVDRIDAKNLITYEFRNDFDLSEKIAGGGGTRKYAFMNVAQSYDFKELRKIEEPQHPLSKINFDMGISPITGATLRYISDLDVYGRGFTKYSLRSDYASLADYNMGLEYRYEKDAAVNQLNGDFFVGLTDKVSLSGDMLHSFETDKTTEASLGVLYSPECWTMEFLVTTTPDDDYRFSVIFSLEGIGKILGVNQTMYVTDSGRFTTNSKRKIR